MSIYVRNLIRYSYDYDTLKFVLLADILRIFLPFLTRKIMTVKYYLSIIILSGLLSACSWSNVQTSPQTTPRSTANPSTANPNTDISSDINSPFGKGTNVNTTLLMQVLERQIGRPYLYGGNSPNGFDCSGLVQYSFSQIGINLPRSTTEQMSALQTISREQLQKGDLAFFKTGSKQYHVAIMTDSHNFVHAPSSGKSVSTSSFSNTYWQKNFIGARRY